MLINCPRCKSYNIEYASSGIICKNCASPHFEIQTSNNTKTIHEIENTDQLAKDFTDHLFGQLEPFLDKIDGELRTYKDVRTIIFKTFKTYIKEI